MTEKYKFQDLRVYQLALDYVDANYSLNNKLPDSERFNLKTQIERAATSIGLNIAEGSTAQTDAEQNRFLGHAIRSYLETITCLDLIIRRQYIGEKELSSTNKLGHELFIKLQAFRKNLRK